VLDELQRALRAISSELAGSPHAIEDDDLIDRLLRQAGLDLDAGPASGAPGRTPEETDALRRALEALARALSGPSLGRYRFASTSHQGVEYEITVDGADVVCTCPGFEYRGQCRHAREVKAAVAAGQGVPADYKAFLK
jgi:hypothetical protein